MKKYKNILIAFICVLLSFFMFFIIFLMIQIKNTDSIVFKADLSVNYRDVVYVDQFIKYIDGELLNRNLVDTSVVGEHQLEVQYRNKYGFVEQKRVNYIVKDVIAPTISLNNPYKVQVGDQANLLDSVFCADDYDDNIKCSIVGEYNINEIGKYQLSIVAKDKSGNKTKKDFVLDVVEKIKKDEKVLQAVNFKDIYKRYKKNNTEIGVDLSKWQEDVDFEKIVQEGVSFVMLKVGGQKEIGGEIVEDPYFSKNIELALQNNLKVGVYFYSHARSESEARKQAKWVVQKLRDYSIDLPIAFDWENWEKYYTYRIGFRTLNNTATSFIEEVERNNYQGMLYSSKYYLENIWYPSDYKKWLAYYTNNNDYSGDYTMWQVTNAGKIDGINGFVDIDVYRK